MANTTGKTLEQYIAENEALKLKVSTLESAQKMNITVDSKKYGQGTISMSGMQRFPLSLHPAQWAELFTIGPAKIRAFVADNAEKIRASAVAAEYALKVTGLKAIPEKTDATRKAYESEWERGFDLAIKDANLKPSNSKFVPLSEVLARFPHIG